MSIIIDNDFVLMERQRRLREGRDSCVSAIADPQSGSCC